MPSLGNLDAYISAVNRIPMLTPQEEVDFARSACATRATVEAAGRLVLSHLRLVVSVSRQYLGYGLPQGDLIQEGNVGLMKAVKRFDPDQGVRLVSYALHWIKAEIHEYILKQLAHGQGGHHQGAAQAVLQPALDEAGPEERRGRRRHPPQHADRRPRSTSVARELNVKPDEVLEMETRLSGGDVALGAADTTTAKRASRRSPTWPTTRSEPTRVLEARHRDWLAGDGIEQALEVLDARSRRIVEERWLKVNDDARAA